ncbi:MAG: DNA internalization-related competence protein ComEC/Rec2 [Dehalococcoidia bacterium]
MTLGALAFAWLLGVAAAAFTGADAWAAVAAASALAAASFALRPRASTLALVALGATLVFAALWRYDSTMPPDMPAGIARWNDGESVRFRAVVSDEPDDRGSTARYRLTVRESYVAGDWRPQSGAVLATAPAFPAYRYGDLLELEGELETPPVLDGFDYRGYLARQGVGSLMAYPEARLLARDRGSPLRAALIDLRTDLSHALARALPEPEASLAAGVLLGKRAQLPADLTDRMNATGTSHLVAVSGQNVAIVAGLALALLAPLVGRRRAAWLALAGVLGYATLVGGEPSVVRAAIMGSLFVVAVALGRQRSGLIALLFAAAIMTALEPQVVHDVSFQLSFAATVGLMTLAPLLAERLYGWASRWPDLAAFPLTRPAAELAAVTVAAIAFTLPITAITFERVSLVAPLANLLAVPAFLAVAATAAVTAVAGLAFAPAAGALGWLAWLPAAYMIAVVDLAADLPLASVELRGVGVGHAVGFYGALALGVLLLARHRPEAVAPPKLAPLRSRRSLVPVPALALVLVLSSALVWFALSTPAQGRLTVTFLDVGQGDAILIEGPEGHRILVDGGPSDDAIAAALDRHLPFHDRRIDLVVLTHPDLDHVAGLPAVLERYDVRSVLASPAEAETAAYRAWRDAVRDAAVPSRQAVAGNEIDLGGGARLVVLSAPPGGDNDDSLVLKLTMGRASVLLPADIGADAEAALVRARADLDSVLYKVAHHGSAGSSSAAFLASVDPLVDVISVGKDNRYGHPADDVLERLAGDAVFRTDLQGDVTVSTDGLRLWVETAR